MEEIIKSERNRLSTRGYDQNYIDQLRDYEYKSSVLDINIGDVFIKYGFNSFD